MRLAFATAALTLCLASGHAFAGTSLCDADPENMVVNCGFETSDFTDWTLSGSAAVLAQSNLYGVDGYDANSGNYGAYFGNQGATLGVHTAADSLTLSENMTLTTNASYTLTFFLAQDTSPTLGYTNYFSAIFDGATLTAVTGAAATNGFVEESFTVTSSGSGSNTLAFQFQNDSGFWSLDDISLDEVPEPASLAAFGIGLVGLGFARRARQAGSK